MRVIHCLLRNSLLTPSSDAPRFLRTFIRKMEGKNMGERTALHFEVIQPRTQLLRVTVVQARNVEFKKSASQSFFDKMGQVMSEKSPDPYIVLNIPDVINGRRQTRTINNQSDPYWDETFEFYMDADGTYSLEITLMEADYISDDSLATQSFDFSTIALNEEISSTLPFGENTQVDFTFYRSLDEASPSLRLSPDLCAEELEFVRKRKEHAYRALRELLGEENGPKNIDQVPCIALLGSGGGFRAMVGLSGVVKALHSSGILDCVTYFAGISGSAWYISGLYSNLDFPKTVTPGEFAEELKVNIAQSPFGLVRPRGIYKYLEEINQKRNAGHLVSFTDFFGLMMRDTLLKSRPEAKLSYQRAALEDGAAPLPLYASVHVKKNVQARVYHEWAEFTPYEVGFTKYGAFKKTELFGSRFHMGRLRLQLPEFPLHYLMGIWGSAFTVLFRQLLWMNKTDEKMNMFMLDSSSAKKEEALLKEVDEYAFTDEDVAEDKHSRYLSHKRNLPKACIRAAARALQEVRSHRLLPYSRMISNAVHMDTSAPVRFINDAVSNVNFSTAQRVPFNIIHEIGQNLDNVEKAKGVSGKVKGMFDSAVEALHATELFNSIAGRAASVYNPLFGLLVKPLFGEDEQVSTTKDDEETFKGVREPLSTADKSLYMVDGGLALNSPYALVLRPERKVQLFISFDFSSRTKDQAPPFKDLLLAALWAKKVGFRFPPVRDIIREKYSTGPVQEYYVFKHPDDKSCPIIVHFVLINNKFKDFKAPGIARDSPEERKMADFSVFEDAGNPFSMFNFQYSYERFDQMSQLMEFNALLGAGVVKQLIAELIDPDQGASLSHPAEGPERSASSGLLGGLCHTLLTPVRKLFPGNKVRM